MQKTKCEGKDIDLSTMCIWLSAAGVRLLAVHRVSHAKLTMVSMPRFPPGMRFDNSFCSTVNN